MAPQEIDQDSRLRRFLATDEGRTVYSFVRGSVFHHLEEVSGYRFPVETAADDLAMQLLTVGMIGLAAEEFVSQKEREVEQLTDGQIRVV